MSTVFVSSTKIHQVSLFNDVGINRQNLVNTAEWSRAKMQRPSANVGYYHATHARFQSIHDGDTRRAMARFAFSARRFIYQSMIRGVAGYMPLHMCISFL
jgi:hypothetical protein